MEYAPDAFDISGLCGLILPLVDIYLLSEYAITGIPTKISHPPAQTKNAGVDAVIACPRINPVYSPNGSGNQMQAIGNPFNCTTLISHFKSEQGTTPYVYLTAVRIEMAKRMLSTTRESIQSVATACGFRDRKRLNIVFAKNGDSTPAQWRQRHKV